MTQDEITARAIQTAKDRRIHVMSVAGRPGIYQASSKSEPGVKRILVNRNGEQSCSCPGFNYRKSCCHVEALRNRLAGEAVRSERATADLLYA